MTKTSACNSSQSNGSQKVWQTQSQRRTTSMMASPHVGCGSLLDNCASKHLHCCTPNCCSKFWMGLLWFGGKKMVVEPIHKRLTNLPVMLQDAGYAMGLEVVPHCPPCDLMEPKLGTSEMHSHCKLCHQVHCQLLAFFAGSE